MTCHNLHFKSETTSNLKSYFQNQYTKRKRIGNGVEEMKGENFASSGESFEIMSLFSDEESESSGHAMVDNDKEECRYEVTPKFIEEKIVAMKDYLLSIAKVEPSQDVPPPHFEHYLALLGRNQKPFWDFETL